MIGFALRWDGQEHGVLWISGDTVLYDGVRQVADRLQVDIALLHLGGVRFPITGPVRYTMTAADAVELCASIRPRTAMPVHYEGWSHFKDAPPSSTEPGDGARRHPPPVPSRRHRHPGRALRLRFPRGLSARWRYRSRSSGSRRRGG